MDDGCSGDGGPLDDNYSSAMQEHKIELKR